MCPAQADTENTVNNAVNNSRSVIAATRLSLNVNAPAFIPRETVKFFCYNVRGLTPSKLNYMLKWLINTDANVYKDNIRSFSEFSQLWNHADYSGYLFGIAIETWNMEPAINHQCVVATSVRRKSETGHSLGGLCVLMDHRLWNSSGRLILRHKHFLTFSIRGVIITAVYFPPSMDETELMTTLWDIPKSDIVCGDFNTDLSCMDDPDNHSDYRMNALSMFMVRNHLTIQRMSSNSKSTLDHVLAHDDFTKRITENSVMWVDPRMVHTDHPRQTVSYQLNNAFNSSECVFGVHSQKNNDFSLPLRGNIAIKDTKWRYNFHCLKDKRIATLLRRDWDRNHFQPSKCLVDAWHTKLFTDPLHFQQYTNADIRELVDLLDDTLLEDIYKLLDHYLLVYDPEECKSHPDQTVSFKMEEGVLPTTGDTIRYYKQLFRAGRKDNPIIGSSQPCTCIINDSTGTNLDPRNGQPNNCCTCTNNDSVLKQGFDAMERLLTDDNHRPDADELYRQPFNNMTPIKVIRFDTKTVLKEFQKYPQGKTGGLDGLDARFLENDDTERSIPSHCDQVV